MAWSPYGFESRWCWFEDGFCVSGYEMGENLFFSSSPHSWTDVISTWQKEVANFQYPNSSINGLSIGHYTQVAAPRRYGYDSAMAVFPPVSEIFYSVKTGHSGHFEWGLPSCYTPPSFRNSQSAALSQPNQEN